MIRFVASSLFVIITTILVETSVMSQDCYRELELAIEIRSALTSLNERLDSLETALREVKKEMIGELVQIKKDVTTASRNIFPYENQMCNKDTPTDCKGVLESGYNVSGIYRIHPKLANNSFLVWCDMETEDGGWAHILNRFDGSQNFNLNWTDYKRGFGNLSGEHWLGLEHMYELTNNTITELLVELVDWENKTVHQLFDNFKIGNESEGYPLKSLENLGGDAGDSLTDHVGIKFSTPDKDNDLNDDEESCSAYLKAGWWFRNCYFSILTGQYVKYSQLKYHPQSFIRWNLFHGYNASLKEARMMIRPHFK